MQHQPLYKSNISCNTTPNKVQNSYSWSLELSADRPQTAGLVIQPFQPVAEDIFIWPVGQSTV